MKTENKLVVWPLVHLNGTSKDQLVENLETVYLKVGEAIAALKQAAPNQRDYYPLPLNWWEAARAQHTRRLKALADLQDELTAEADLIQRGEQPHDWFKFNEQQQAQAKEGEEITAELLAALKRVRQAFYVDGKAKALKAAFEGTKELVAKAELIAQGK